MNLCHPGTIKQLMAEAGITFRKEYGQNFLINPMIPEDIADAAAPTSESLILEIGPGIGCLTSALAQRYRRVVAVEIDRGLLPVLEKTLAEYDHVTVVEGDILKTDLQSLLVEHAKGLPVSVCANLPYYITTPILMYLLECGVPFDCITVMVQNEVADRLVSRPGGKDYGAITAVLHYYGEVKRLFRVPAGCFMPAPKVDSAVVQIRLHREKHVVPKHEQHMFALIRAAFEMRRKTLVNAVCAALPHSKEAVATALAAMGLDPAIRGERLSIEEFARLSDLLETGSV